MCLEFQLKISKLETLLSKDQGRGGKNSGPKDLTVLGNVVRSLSSYGILAQGKIDIMQNTPKLAF